MMQITLIGLGMGTPETLTLGGHGALRQADAVIGAARLLETLPDEVTDVRAAMIRPQEILQWLLEHGDYSEVCVVFSGDTGFYSGARRLRPLLEENGYNVRTLPGITTVQALAARLGFPWQDVHLASAHGTECDVVAHVLNHPVCFFLTGGDITPAVICDALCDAELGDTQLTVAQWLGYPDERIETASARELAGRTFAPLSAVITRLERPVFRVEHTGGVPDSAFLRAKVPMTKQEVRSVIVAKMAVARDDIVYDVGAGTGSVSVELALHARWGRVYAVENNPEACKLIRQNREKFGVYNLICVEGTAPDAIRDLPVPDAVFIGGSKGRLRDILAELQQRNPRIRVVVSAVTLETLSAAVEAMQALDFADVETVQVSVSRSEKLGASHLLRAQNPIFLISGGGGHE